MSKISDFASNSIMGVVRKIVNHIVDNVDPQISDATDHLPARFSGTFNDSTRNLTMTIESQGASAENLVATVNIPAGGGGSGGPTYSAGNGISITPENAIEIDTDVTATVDDVNTKVAKNQGTANAGKVLGIGSDGMVSPVDAGGSGNEVYYGSLSNLDYSKLKVGSSILLVIGHYSGLGSIVVNASGLITSINTSNKMIYANFHGYINDNLSNNTITNGLIADGWLFTNNTQVKIKSEAVNNTYNYPEDTIVKVYY